MIELPAIPGLYNPASGPASRLPEIAQGVKMHVHFGFPSLYARGDGSVVLGEGVEFNSYYKNNWVMYRPYESFIELKPEMRANELNNNQKWWLNIRELSSLPGFSSISIEVNGHRIAEDFHPLIDAWRWDHFDLTDYLHEGQNSVKILLGNSPTMLWLDQMNIASKRSESLDLGEAVRPYPKV